MKTSFAILVALCGAVGLTTAHASNVALGKTVTEQGDFGVAGWGSGILAPGSSLTDGTFFPETTQWDQNSVWWDENNPSSVGNTITIDLGGTYTIDSFTVQADDNDTYRVQYWDSVGSSWVTAWDVPSVPSYGLVTRSTILGAPITTAGLRFSATGGDLYYAVSEIQAFGKAVPETGSTLALASVAFAMLGAIGRKFRA